MLGIAIKNEFLDLPPGTRLESEKINGFLEFNSQLSGEYSMPLECRLTATNMRLLEFAGLIQTKVNNKGIDCAVYDAHNQVSVGKLKIESPKHNLNSANRGTISLYYLTGSAGFFQDIKDVKMYSADFGGARSFAWDNYAMAGPGFWSHIHAVINGDVNAFDYAFYPVVNKAWTENVGGTQITNEVMNNMVYSGGQVQFVKKATDNIELNVIVPFPYLHYVMKQVVAHVGWTIAGGILDDPDFKSITMINMQAIDWGFMSPQQAAHEIIFGPSATPGTHAATIQFDLADHMPDMSISEFLLAVKNRFGWWYSFDNQTKTITIHELQNVVASTIKDLTRYASPLIPKKVAQTAKIYSLKNEFVGEYAGGKPELKNVKYQGPVDLIADLPAPSLALADHTYLVRAENNFYICRPVPGATDDTYSWQFYAYNVYDVEPDGATESVTTKATCLGSEKYSAYLDLVPRIDMAGNWNRYSYNGTTWGIHLMMYKGKKNNKAAQPVPFATSGIYDSNGNVVANWSLAFECQLFDGTQVGLYHEKWEKMLQAISNPETFEFSLALPLAEYEQLKFSDTIIIDGVKMYLTKTKPVIPYNDELMVEAIRIY